MKKYRIRNYPRLSKMHINVPKYENLNLVAYFKILQSNITKVTFKLKRDSM